MLPEDAKQRKSLAIDKVQQSSVIDHFGPEDTRPIPYSDDAFKAAAIEWLIETNQVCPFLQYIILLFILSCALLQPIQTFSRPTFKNMIDIASRAKREINLPSPKQSRACILQMFKQQLRSLRARLSVCFPSFLFPFLFTDTPLPMCCYCCIRAPLSKAKLASLAMRGRPATPTRTSQ